MFEEILHLNTNFVSIVRAISKKYDITLPQALILLNISINGTSMSSLAHQLGLDPSTITRNIEKLEGRNLLYRERSTLDTRVINIYKSNTGKMISENIENDTEDIFNHAVDDRVDFKDSLQKINWNLEKSRL